MGRQGINSEDEFANRVAAYIDEGVAIRAGLAVNGPRYLSVAMNNLSLREIARRIDRSPTYLSMVLNRKTVISPDAFVDLCELFTKTERTQS